MGEMSSSVPDREKNAPITASTCPALPQSPEKRPGILVPQGKRMSDSRGSNQALLPASTGDVQVRNLLSSRASLTTWAVTAGTRGCWHGAGCMCPQHPAQGQAMDHFHQHKLPVLPAWRLTLIPCGSGLILIHYVLLLKRDHDCLLV